MVSVSFFFFFKKENNTLFSKNTLILIKSDSNDIYNVTNDFCFK